MTILKALERLPAIALHTALVALTIAGPVATLYCFPTPLAVDKARLAACSISMLGMLGLFVLAGRTMKGRAFGVLIDERNRFSLSRLQMTLWSILIIASLYTFYMANIIRGADALDALDISLDWSLIALMGISTGSFLTAPIALNRKTQQPEDDYALGKAGKQLMTTQGLKNQPTSRGQVLLKKTPADARIGDLIRGEEVGNANVVDLNRIQMLIITLLVVLVYAGCMFKLATTGPWLVKEFPTIHQTLISLILLSHGGYLIGKALPSAQTNKGPGLEGLARGMQISQQASDLARTAQALLDAPPAGDVSAQPLRDAVTLARAAAAEAATLPMRAAEPDFNALELAAMEGRLSAIAASLASLGGSVPASAIASAASPEVVSKVQQKLRALGYAGVQVTGVVDLRTEDAVRAELAKLDIARSGLDSRMYRYYEEVAQLI